MHSVVRRGGTAGRLLMMGHSGMSSTEAMEKSGTATADAAANLRFDHSRNATFT